MKIDDTTRLTRKQIADLFGLTGPAVTKWSSRVHDPPCPRNGKTYDLAAIIHWRLAKGAQRSGKTQGIVDARQRLIEAQAEKAEDALAVSRGRLLPTSEVIPALDNMLVACKKRIMNLPRTIATTIASCDTPEEIEAEVYDRCVEALEELAQYTPGVDGETDAAPSSRKNAASKPVGGRRKKAKR
jgi:phage terminase Nu1 subunit (DNA packaging protein)